MFSLWHESGNNHIAELWQELCDIVHKNLGPGVFSRHFSLCLAVLLLLHSTPPHWPESQHMYLNASLMPQKCNWRFKSQKISDQYMLRVYKLNYASVPSLIISGLLVLSFTLTSWVTSSCHKLSELGWKALKNPHELRFMGCVFLNIASH